MALPVTITGLRANSASIGYTTQPFISSAGNVYVFGMGTTTNLLRAFKATDPTTSFSNVGTDITMTSGNIITGAAGIQQGDLIHIATIDGSSATSMDLRYHVFDMAADEWSVTNEAVVTGFSVDLTSTGVFVDINIRSDGDVIILYNGARVTITLPRNTVYYARREAGVWTTDIQVSNAGAINWYAGGIVRGSSDRMHFFLLDDTNSDIYQRTLTSANSLQAFPASFDTSVNTSQDGILQMGCSYDSGGTQKCRYPYQDSGGTTTGSVKFDSADTPTISLDADITGTSGTESDYHRNCMVADGTTLYHIYVDSNSDILYQTNANDGGWSAVSTLVTATSNGVRGNIISRAGRIVLAYIYNNSTTPVYNELDIRAAPDQPFDIDATATLTWGGRSTATSAADIDATASVTWTGNGIIPAAFDSDAAASVTWVGSGIIFASGAFSAAAVASLTWNGRSFAAATFDQDATALLTWNGRSFAASAFDQDATASLTWNGRSFAASSLNAPAAATLTWNGEEVVDANVEAAWASAAAASAAWAGESTVTADLTSTAVASVTWNGTGIFPGAVSIEATASLTWNGTGIASGEWASAVTSDVIWNGAAFAASSFDQDALSTLTWNGLAIASGAWDSDATALLEWIGEANGAPTTADAAWAAFSTATVTFTAETIAAAGFSMDAVSLLKWDTPFIRPPNLGNSGDRVKNKDEKDILFLFTLAATYMEHRQ